MSVPRLYTSQPLETGASISLEPETAHHVKQVLRLRPGAELELFNGSPCAYRARLAAGDDRRLNADVLEALAPEPEAKLRVHLAQAISRGERMDLVIQKAVELGATRICPLFSERSVVRLVGDRLEQRQRHWQNILIHACAQSGRNRVPELQRAVGLDSWLERPHQGTGLVLDPTARTGLGNLSTPAEPVQLLIGPEGGLTPEEINRASAKQFVPVRLGPRIMRTETAALAALAVLQCLWGDLRN